MKKLNILALMVFLAAVVGVFTLNNRTTLEIQTRVMALLSPFIHSSAAIEESVRNATIPDIDPSVLRQDNERLQIEVEKLRVIAQKYNQALEEINQLRGQLEFKKSSPLNMTAARVVRRVSTSWWNTLIIDKGLLDGLGTDTPVIT
jgi:rod shape-determining protein MreC